MYELVYTSKYTSILTFPPTARCSPGHPAIRLEARLKANVAHRCVCACCITMPVCSLRLRHAVSLAMWLFELELTLHEARLHSSPFSALPASLHLCAFCVISMMLAAALLPANASLLRQMCCLSGQVALWAGAGVHEGRLHSLPRPNILQCFKSL